MRSQARRVKIFSWIAISNSVSRLSRPPTSEYSPSLFSRTMMKSMSPAFRPLSGLVIPSSNRAGRRFTYCLNPRRIGISKPHREM